MNYFLLVGTVFVFNDDILAQIFNESESHSESVTVQSAKKVYTESEPLPETATEQYSNNSLQEKVHYAPKEKRRRLLKELITALVGEDEIKVNILTDPEHPYINATVGLCFNNVITSFARACIVSKAFGGWRTFKGLFAVACKAIGMKRHKITEVVNGVCKKFPHLKI